MKTLENQTLLYDEDCPMCTIYTSGFIKTGMLDENGRKPFINLTQEEQNYVDLKRATNEIALVDTKNRTVIYGIDSLLKVIGNSFPLIEKIGTTKPINYSLKKLYKFISYNRKVIVPSIEKENNNLKCIPDFNYKYRTIYLVIALFITVLVLYKCAHIISILPKSNIYREISLAVGQVLFQIMFLARRDLKTIINYIGNLLTISLFGSLILLPLIILNSIVNLPQTAILGWFAITVILMIFEHYKRIKILKLPNYLTLTWIIYRVIALIIILNL